MYYMKNVIEINNLTKSYDNVAVIKSININIVEGTIHALLGKNGAGKTTILKSILGLIKPTSGSIFILGENQLTEKGRNVLKQVGCMIETPGFYPNLTGTENLSIFAKLRELDKQAVQEALTIVNLPYADSKKFKEYSLGMKQRLAIANAIMHDPDILILDEPTNGLDPSGVIEIRELCKEMKRQGKTLLISSHILSEVEQVADEVSIIDEGELVKYINLKKMNENSQVTIHIFTSNFDKVESVLLEAGVSQHNMINTAKGVRLLSKDMDISEVNKLLTQNDVDIEGIMREKLTLEEQFQRVTETR